ncbi:MAG: PAS domain-containing protein, partial [Candidatus Hodarchaeales archaeon]
MDEKAYLPFHYIPFSVCIVNNKNRFLSVNKSMMETFQYTAKEFSNIQFQDLFPNQLLPSELALFPKIKHHYPKFTMTRKDGTIGTFGISVNPLILSEEKKVRLITFQDLAIAERAKRQGIMEWLTHVQNNVAIILYRIGNIGPEAIEELGTSIIKEKDRALMKLGIFTAAAIGQGGQHSTGLFGPLPVPENDDILCLVFAISLNDPTQTDPRAKGKRFCMVNIVYPRSMEALFNDRSHLIEALNTHLFSLKTVQELNKHILVQLRRSLIFLEQDNKPTEERTLENKLNATYELARSLTSTSDLIASFEAMAVFAERTLEFKFFSAAIIDRLTENFWFISQRGYQQDLNNITMRINDNKSIMSNVYINNKPLLVNNVAECKFYRELDS